jgi:hypothetical protein
LIRGLTSSTTDFNWNILNDNNFKIQNKTSTNAYADRFVISSVGNVGIGITAPGLYKLNVNGSVYISGGLTTNASIYTSSTLTTNGALSTTNGSITTGTGSTTTAFLTSTGGIQTAAINATGGITTTVVMASVRVGIGVASVRTGYLLDVGRGTGGTTDQTSIRYFQSSGTGLWQPGGTIVWGGINSVRLDGDIWCLSTLVASSDIRIKEDIQDIYDDTALNMILAIEPKKYKYIDKVFKGDKKVYGFIVQ